MSESDKPTFLTGSVLYWHARIAQVFQYGAVLLYLGFESTEILPVFEKHSFMTDYIRKAQELYASQ